MGIRSHNDIMQTARLELVRDVLDSQLYDRNRRKMGKVDGLVAELRPGQPPRLVRIEGGTSVLAARVHPRLGAWVDALSRRFSPRRGRPVRVDWADVRTIGPEVELGVDAKQTGALAWETWVRKHFVDHLPFCGRRIGGNDDH